ncbi:hypothetical protein C8F01DRAFT_1379444 [Mycena amicta]|nr:hypothetical protein C8F01DRAFT_1379444 [Mycena amicta]
MASTWLAGSEPPAFPTEARRVPPSTSDIAYDASSRYYIIGVLLALGLVLAIFLLWARLRFPAARRVTLSTQTRTPASAAQSVAKTRCQPHHTRPLIFDAYIDPKCTHGQDPPAVLWIDMLPLSLSPLPPPRPPAGKEEVAGPDPLAVHVPAQVAAIIAMPRPASSSLSDVDFEFAVGTVEVEIV